MESYCVVFPAKEQVEIREETIAEPERNEVLCAAQVSLISIGTELTCLSASYDPGTYWEEWVRYPFHPGYSMVGRVIEVGSSVTSLRQGDRVAVYAPHQQFFKAQAHECYLIPDDIGDEDATWRSLACTTQLGVRRAQLQLGENVGVIGLGLLGQLVVQYLSLSGARRIIAIDPAQSRLDVANRHGATHLLPMQVNEALPAIQEITKGRMLDVVFDITGRADVLASASRLLHKLGRLILIGDSPTPSQQTLGPRVVSNALTIIGVHGYAVPPIPAESYPWTIPEMSSLFFEYLRQERMNVADLITHRYSALEAPEVYQKLRQNRSDAIGILLEWQSI